MAWMQIAYILLIFKKKNRNNRINRNTFLNEYVCLIIN